MKRFKTGDFVRCIVDDRIVIADADSTGTTDDIFWDKWQPKEDEWVVVYDKEDKSFFGVMKYDEEVKETLKDPLNNFSIVEPFLGELPSFLKDV